MTGIVNRFAVGPITGESGKSHVRLFGALPQGELGAGNKLMWGRVRWRKQGGDSWSEPRKFRLNGNFDGSGVVVINGLEPGTRYQYQAGWVRSEEDGEPLDWHAIESGCFSTDQPTADQTTFLFGSCCYRFVGLDGIIQDDRADKIFAEMSVQAEQHKPDFVLFGGDQVYADSMYSIGAAATRDDFDSLYRASFSQKHLAKLLRETNSYMILDDHEIENNWPAKADAELWTNKYPAAIKAYQIYQASHSPAAPLNEAGTYLDRDPDKFWYTFSRGPADFFVMDVRTERVLSRWPWQRKMISEVQEQAFVEWLDRDPERVKVLVTSVVMFPEQRRPFRGKDAWEGFRHQRQRLLAAMAKSASQKLVVLSGDVHASLYASLTLNGGKKVHSWTCSGLFWPTALFAFRWYRPMIRVPGLLYSGWGRPLGQVSVPGEVFSDNAFSVVSFDDRGARFALFDRRNRPVPDASRTIEW
ncbi:alkaline phosphatase family protein [Alcanivorax sp. VBW004]|uniref:alkaline phosphatase D family protein n=1 Tax=Alcanivorax sp. VBW004 TaxID=1287708 RepID=UPI0012BD08F7|nr:alkaline phosphatase D family protein [Alcanivorax sp. VBW004]MTT53667.1 alkaline phosphatase family protein [Alcanivorax sp. VBW004]